MDTPLYIPAADLAALPIEHSWNDWDPFEPLGWPDDRIKTRLGGVSDIGITVFSLGCAEWVLARLSPRLDDRVAEHYVEAFWSVCLGVIAALPPPTVHEEWLGPVRGPMNLALMTVLNTIYLAEHGPPIQNGALAAVIVEHVCGKQPAFSAWYDIALDRLGRFAGRTEEEPMGSPLPRAIIDPDHEWDESRRVELLRRDFADIDLGQNPLLQELSGSSIELDGRFLSEDS